MESYTNSTLELVPVSQSAGTDNTSTDAPFIQANTIGCSLEEIKQEHIIPVFVKDNEPLISHDEFIDATLDIATDIYHSEMILKPSIRVSHPIKGRVPDAKDKPANKLQDWEKTLYYERMAFIIELPSIRDSVGGNVLNLTIGGVKAYNLDNLYSRTQSEQHFKIFVGFKNRVCTNLCVWTDGLMDDVKVKSLAQLKSVIRSLLESYRHEKHLEHLKAFTNHSITEEQFAHLIGRCRMYQHLPGEMKANIPPILFGDMQMTSVVKDYYRDNSFCRDASGNINLWKLYNLFTGANKSTYINSFASRSVNAFELVDQVRNGLEHRSDCWYLN
jgi:hypothetical protein